MVVVSHGFRETQRSPKNSRIFRRLSFYFYFFSRFPLFLFFLLFFLFFLSFPGRYILYIHKYKATFPRDDECGRAHYDDECECAQARMRTDEGVHDTHDTIGFR